MIELLAVLLWVVLASIATLHAVWGLGWHWPCDSEESLARTVVGWPGTKRMPSAVSCFTVAALLSVVSLWPLFAAGFLQEAWPRWLTLLAGAAIAAVFVGRGAAGYIPAWRRMHSQEPFARLDRRLYSPLCLFIGAGFLVILVMRSSL